MIDAETKRKNVEKKKKGTQNWEIITAVHVRIQWDADTSWAPVTWSRRTPPNFCLRHSSGIRGAAHLEIYQ